MSVNDENGQKTGKNGNQTQNIPALGSRLRGNDEKGTEPEKKHSLIPSGKRYKIWEEYPRG